MHKCKGITIWRTGHLYGVIQKLRDKCHVLFEWPLCDFNKIDYLSAIKHRQTYDKYIRCWTESKSYSESSQGNSSAL